MISTDLGFFAFCQSSFQEPFKCDLWCCQCGVGFRDVRVLSQGHPMDSGFETALDTCLENAEHASNAPDTKVAGDLGGALLPATVRLYSYY
eukprot:COSAG01_NODE_28992_length_647_cov_54.062044_1_plen_91_part_00